MGEFSREISQLSKIRPPPSFSSHLSSSPTGVFSRDYSTLFYVNTVEPIIRARLSETHTSKLNSVISFYIYLAYIFHMPLKYCNLTRHPHAAILDKTFNLLATDDMMQPSARGQLLEQTRMQKVAKIFLPASLFDCP